MDIILILPILAIVFIFGAAIGSFINVVVYRLPAKLSILWPPSRCPHCLNQLRAYDNVPVLGWLWLRGRCRYCKSKISKRYPLVEAVTGLAFVLIFLRFGVSSLTLGYCAFVSWLLALSLIDLDTMTLPNQLTQSGLILGVGFQLMLSFFSEAHPGWENQLIVAISGAVLGLWLFDAIAVLGSIIFQKSAMGGGDAKLAAMMGAWLGWKYLLLAGFIACALGAFGGGSALALGWLKRSSRMPFGPFLALGSILTLFGGEAILGSYLQLFVSTH